MLVNPSIENGQEKLLKARTKAFGLRVIRVPARFRRPGR